MRLGGASIAELTAFPVTQAAAFLEQLELSEARLAPAEPRNLLEEPSVVDLQGEVIGELDQSPGYGRVLVVRRRGDEHAHCAAIADQGDQQQVSARKRNGPSRVGQTPGARGVQAILRVGRQEFREAVGQFGFLEARRRANSQPLRFIRPQHER